MKKLSAVLVRHETLLLMFCSALFGVAWGLNHERGLIPNPWWFTPALERFCLVLMGWTALLHADPLQKLFWSVTDFAAITLPYFAGVLWVPAIDLPVLISYWVSLGKVASAVVFGVAVTQAIYSLLPGWRVQIGKRNPSLKDSTSATTFPPNPEIGSA